MSNVLKENGKLKEDIEHVLSLSRFTPEDQKKLINILFSITGRREKTTNCSACLRDRQSIIYNWAKDPKFLLYEYTG